jgi:hypothetical protein
MKVVSHNNDDTRQNKYLCNKLKGFQVVFLSIFVF